MAVVPTTNGWVNAYAAGPGTTQRHLFAWTPADNSDHEYGKAITEYST
jgi:hypothetical protein